MAIKRILVANRGEIAVRIIRTCKALGIETVLTVSTVDRESLGARLADRTLCIGPGPSSESYLKPETIVQAALGQPNAMPSIRATASFPSAPPWRGCARKKASLHRTHDRNAD